MPFNVRCVHTYPETHSSRYIVHTYAFAVAYISMSFRYHRASGDARACTYARVHTHGRTERVSLASLTAVHSMGKYWLHIMHSNTRVYVCVIALYLFANNTHSDRRVCVHVAKCLKEVSRGWSGGAERVGSLLERDCPLVCFSTDERMV